MTKVVFFQTVLSVVFSLLSIQVSAHESVGITHISELEQGLLDLENYQWQPVSEDVLERIERDCAPNEVARWAGTIGFGAGSAFFFIIGAAGTVTGVVPASLVGLGVGALALGGAVTFYNYPYQLQELKELIYELQNGIDGPYVQAFRKSMEDQGIVYGQALRAFNVSLLGDTICYMPESTSVQQMIDEGLLE